MTELNDHLLKGPVDKAATIKRPSFPVSARPSSTKHVPGVSDPLRIHLNDLFQSTGRNVMKLDFLIAVTSTS